MCAIQTDTPPPVFILVRPQLGENIGAAARAMLNFGLDRMRLVAPRDGWPNVDAWRVASGAGRVLDRAGLFPDLAAAIADCDIVFATTARPRDLVKEVVTPEEAITRARTLGARGHRVGILFGPERAGLENADIACANAIIAVPTGAEFPSLNLAQCVLLVAYEWGRGVHAGAPPVPEIPPAELPSRAEIEHLGRHYEEELAAAGYFFPAIREESMKLGLRNMWGRLPLTRADVQALHGILRQITQRHGRGDGH